ncbi:hypothetical protein AMK14_01295 [Streptomyces sp. TSRI0445]|uniref:phosphopantetheine-binding protein n=1 Tax=Streptomyces TaxID=1883 RepID=UPI00035CCCCF|nr:MULTISPECIES: phosphopantetheine-binding protein [Streptomyces]OKI71990.1 hypothetical protein AMK14_01295 [Streptomyces sp. TSRI0445]UIZ15623.1 phosphopantetheine-binding protein [Streptomyces sp. R527F]WSU80720.1 phosphopantetheine-binding protein [Streptomyces globisporus]
MTDATPGRTRPQVPLVAGEELRTALAALIGIAPAEIEDDANLIQLGLESLQMMRLATKWRRAGLTATFGDLAASPTYAAWNELIVRTLKEQERDTAG